MASAVDRYLYDILAPSLKDYNVSETYLQYLLDTIHMQMTSLLRHWNEPAFRNALLLLGLEEGSFYQPACKTDLRCFIVVTLRNSPFELLQSNAFPQSGLNKRLTDNDVKSITSTAIRYFSKMDFSKLSIEAKASQTEDYYLSLSTRYPISWLALQKASAGKSKCSDYAKLSFDKPFMLEELTRYATSCAAGSDYSKMTVVCLDGYSSEFDEKPLDIGMPPSVRKRKTHSKKSFIRRFFR